MSGSKQDHATMSVDEKLDFLVGAVTRLMGQMTTMNGRLDAHDRQLTLVERVPGEPKEAGVANNDINNEVLSIHGGRAGGVGGQEYNHDTGG
ncbi:hypothetical protein GUJ93_ZPchr0001g33064 [Zizania palustris]|uniref:Uncharacterized protein n=1 Tax=Zizania palustris TaxID=103762 RepID=A0A8J5VSL7_ZIZPA|nr:hypothetical protein GUJ93_ZPchr0001g33064 [Zizania palustris]